MPDKTETTLKPKAVSSTDLDTLRRIYEQFGRPFLYVLAGALLIIVVGLKFRTRQASKFAEASDLYWSARTPQALESIPDDYPKSPLVPLARIRAAKDYFDSGQYARALNLYRDFQEQHPDHFMIDTARMGEWHSREMLGQIQDALRSFARFSEEQPDHFLMPQAVLGQARCLETLGRHAEAQTVYEQFLASERHAAWADAVQDKLKNLKRRMKEPDPAIVMPAAPPVAERVADPDHEAEEPVASDLPPLITIPDFSPIPDETP